MVEDPDRPPAATARAYYHSLDRGAYDRLAELLAPGFVQERPDRRFEGREPFVRFMREGRPRTDTTHPIDALYREETDGEGADVAVRGRLLTAEGERLARFVDVFTIEGARISRIETFTR